MNNNIISLLTAISSYCVENPDYCFWFQNKSFHYRLYLGQKTTYDQVKKTCEYDFGIINKEFINKNELAFEYGESESATIATLGSYHDWQEKDIHRYKLFAYCRERVDNNFLYLSCFNQFFKRATEAINLEQCLVHGSFKNANDWDFFVSNLTQNDWKNFWANNQQVINLANYVNDNFNENNKKLFIAPLIKSDFLNEINEQSLNFFQFLQKTHKLDELKNYSQYKIVNNFLINNDVFSTIDGSAVIEKVITNQNIFKFIKNDTSSINDCNNYYLSIINELNLNTTLKKCGLIEIDSIINIKDFSNVFYINKKKNSVFNAEHFKEILLEILDKPNTDLKETIPVIISNWYYNNSLKNKAQNSSKIKI